MGTSQIMKQTGCILCLTIVFLLSDLTNSMCCGPHSFEATFIRKHSPDQPREAFSKGQLGILLPTYNQSYLVLAYRYLNGIGLSEKERKELFEPIYETGPSEVNAWLDARGAVPGASPVAEIRGFRRITDEDSYSEYLNCHDDAFRAARITLLERIRRFGASSSEVKDWLAGQDAVFSNCSAHGATPDKAQPNLNPLIYKDREYQIASALFYDRKFDEAYKSFTEIGKDSSSPWNRLARYLEARSLIRKATMTREYGKIDLVTLAKAQDVLKGVLEDESMKSYHDPAQALLGFVRFRLEPQKRLHELARTLIKKDAKSIKQIMSDYSDLFPLAMRSKQPDPGLKDDDLTDWIVTFKRRDDAAGKHAVSKWKENHAVHWLIAALAGVDKADQNLPELMEQASKLHPDSDGYLTANYYLAKLYTETGNREEARKLLDRILTKYMANPSRSVINLFLAERIRVAVNLDEFLTLAPRVPASVSYDIETVIVPIKKNDETYPFFGKYANGRAFFDADSAKVINRHMPLEMLRQAATKNILPPDLHTDLAMMVWMRAMLLHRTDIGESVAPVLRKLKPKFAKYIDAYFSAKNEEEREFASVFMMVKFPGILPYVVSGLRDSSAPEAIDSYTDKWWCGVDFSEMGKQEKKDNGSDDDDYSPTLNLKSMNSVPEFISSQDTEKVTAESEKLAEYEAAMSYLTRKVIERAAKDPADPRIPEALHLVVRQARYACSDKDTPTLSKQAFRILHKRYSKTRWAEKTPYWY